MRNFKHLLLSTIVAIAQAAMLFVANGVASAQSIVMASTTSTEQSGLFGHLLPAFKQATGIEIKVVALGTGQALDMGRRGDADVLFVHDQAAEEKLVADGFAVKRYPVMYNDFVLIGPKADPAGVSGKDIVQALKTLAAGNGPFRFTRRQERHPRRRAALLEGRWRVGEQGQRLQGVRLRHGPGAEHGRPAPAPMCWPIGAPGCPSKTAAIWRCWSKVTASCSTSTA